MMKVVVYFAVVVVVVFADLDAQLTKGEKKNRRRRPLPPPPTPQVLSDTDVVTAATPTPPGSSLHLPPGHAVVSWWEEKVPGKQGAIKEGGFSSVNEQVVAVGAFGRNLLKKFGYVGATILYDFNQNSSLSAVRVRQPQTCFLLPIKDGLNFQDAAAALVARNNSATTIPRSVVFRDVRGDKQLSQDDVTKLNGTNRAVVTFCRGLPIYKTKDVKEKKLPTDRQITVVGLDELITLGIPKAANADAFSLEPAKLSSVGRLGLGTGRVLRKQASRENQSAAGKQSGASGAKSGQDTGKSGQDKGDKGGKSAQDKGDKAVKSAQDKGDKAGSSAQAKSGDKGKSDKGKGESKAKSGEGKGDNKAKSGEGKGDNKAKSGEGKRDNKGKESGKDKKSGKGESGKKKGE